MQFKIDLTCISKLMSNLKILVLTGVLSLNGAPVLAATYYVATNGNDSYSGTSSQPFRTPQKAANIASPGDTVLLRAGTYPPFTVSRSGLSGAPITFKNYPGESPLIRDDSSQSQSNTVQTVQIYQAQWIVIDGIRVSRGENGVLLYSGASNNTIMNCEVSDSWESGILVYGNSHNNLVKNCKVYNTNQVNWPRGSAQKNGQSWGAGLTCGDRSNGNIFEDNYVYWNHGEGLSATNGCNGTIMRRNVVADNWSVNLYVDASTNTTVDSNFVYLSTDGKNWNQIVSGMANKSNALGIGLSVEAYGNSTASLNGLKLTNNIVVNANGGVFAFQPELSTPYTGWTVDNNTLVKNDVGIRIENAGSSIANNTFRNNIILQNAGGNAFYMNPSGANTLRNNLYFGTAQLFAWGTSTRDFAGWSSLSGEANSRWSDPKLENSSAILPRFWSDGSLPSASPIVPLTNLILGFRLTTISPAIDAGVSVSTFNTDILGTSRSQGNSWDIGAHELVIGSSTTVPVSNLRILP